MQWKVAGLGLALALAGCSEAPPQTFTRSHTTVESTGAGLRISIAGVTLLPEGLVYHQESTSTPGRPGRTVQTLGGHGFTVRDGVFVLGGREYGPAPEGATVRVTPAGVFVDGERRGALPEAR